jgi:protein TonB
MGFVLGLVVALSVLFVALEWNTDAREYDFDERLLEDVAEELFVSMADDEEQLVAVVEEKPQQQVAEQVKVVDVVPESSPDIDQQVQPMTVGEMEELNRDLPKDEPLPPVATSMDDEPVNFRIVEQLPEFPGGMSAFVSWLTKNLKYPPEAQRSKTRGRVVVAFIVNRDGTISGERVLHAVDPLLDAEAIRVIRSMPRWKPGIQNNNPCRTMIAVPVVFDM